MIPTDVPFPTARGIVDPHFKPREYTVSRDGTRPIEPVCAPLTPEDLPKWEPPTLNAAQVGAVNRLLLEAHRTNQRNGKPDAPLMIESPAFPIDQIRNTFKAWTITIENTPKNETYLNFHKNPPGFASADK